MISVIIPNCVDKTYLVRCLNSIKRQSYKGIEILLITNEEIDEIEAAYGVKAVKVESEEKYAGISEAVKTAAGEYIYFCTTTSVLAPNVLETLVSVEENEFPSATYCLETASKTFIVCPKPMNTIFGKLFEKELLEKNNVQLDENVVLAEYFFNMDYCKGDKELIFEEDAYVYETDRSVLNQDYEEVEEAEIKKLLENLTLLSGDSFDYHADEIVDLIKKVEITSEELLYWAEEHMHSAYNVNYALALPLVRLWWTEISEERNEESYSKLVSYLKKYETEEDYIALILMVCGLGKEQYSILKNNTLKNALFFLAESNEAQQILSGAMDGNVKFGKNSYFYKGGKLFTGLVEENNEWWYMENGVINKAYHGLVENEYGLWAVTFGKIAVNFNGLKQIGGVKAVFVDGRVDDTLNGFTKSGNGWYYFKDGIIDDDFTGLAKNDYGWWYVQNGVINQNYDGIAENEYGTWAVLDGKIATKLNGLQQVGNVKGVFENGKLDQSYSGLLKPEDNWLYFKDGIVDISYTGLAKNDYGWWYVENGTLNLDFNGLAENEYGVWYVENGAVVTDKAEV